MTNRQERPRFEELPEATLRRQALVDDLAREGVTDRRVLSAMRKVQRHRFVPDAPLAAAYANRPVEIGYGQTISQPLIVGIMTQALRLSGKERALEIGTGSGYQAAILSLLADEVFSIEVVEPLAAAARHRLVELGYENVHVRVGNGFAGWHDAGPFDRILLTAAPDATPRKLVDELRDGGLLVAPIGAWPYDQELVRIQRVGTQLVRENLGPVAFVPMVRERALGRGAHP